MDGPIASQLTHTSCYVQERDALNTIAIVAVLIANVTFLGYLTSPGGPHPLWETCYYSNFVAFTVLNGIAFLASLLAMIAVTFLPWMLRGRNTPGTVSLVNAGLVLLGIAILAFVGSFCWSGLVSGSAEAPDPSCGLLKCSEGGLLCQNDDQQIEDMLSLNGIKGQCFLFKSISNDSTAYAKAKRAFRANQNLQGFGLNTSSCAFAPSPAHESPLAGTAGAPQQSLSFPAPVGAPDPYSPDLNTDVGCYFVVRRLQASDISGPYSSTPKGVLCTTSSQDPPYHTLQNLLDPCGSLLVPYADQENGTSDVASIVNRDLYFPVVAYDSSGRLTSLSQCQGADLMQDLWGFQSHKSEINPKASIYITHTGDCPTYLANASRVSAEKLPDGKSLCYSLFRTDSVALYDELRYRCYHHEESNRATLCGFGFTDSDKKSYQSGAVLHDNFSLDGLALSGFTFSSTGSKYVSKSSRLELGNEAIWHIADDASSQESIAIYVVFGMSVASMLGVLVITLIYKHRKQ